MRWRISEWKPTTYALASANVALAGAIAVGVWQGSEASRLLATPPNTGAMSWPVLTVAMRDSELRSIRDRALLYETRSYSTPAARSAKPEVPPLPKYELSGMIIIPLKPAEALLKSGVDGKFKRVKPGDTLEGWIIQAVEKRRVVLGYGDERREIRSAVSDASSSSHNLGLRSAPIEGHSAGPSAIEGIRTLGGQGATAPANMHESMPEAARSYRPPAERSLSGSTDR